MPYQAEDVLIVHSRPMARTGSVPGPTVARRALPDEL